MKINAVETVVVGTPWRELTFVEVITDEGLRGVGEVRMVNKTDTLLAAIDELAARYVMGTDPFDVHRLAWNIQVGDYGRPGEVAQSALAAVDVACWDLMGQALGVPVWKLLGGRFRERVPAYANGWYRTKRQPDAVAALAADVVARGYRALKIDPFGAASAELASTEQRRAIAIVAAVREAVGPDVQIMIEMHGRFTAATATRISAQLERFDPEWLEEPVPPGDDVALRNVRQATRIPVATGERVHTLAEFTTLLSAGLIDVVQADLTHFGGLTGLRHLAGLTAGYHVVLAPHNVCGPVGTAANVHFAVSTPQHKILEHFNDFTDPWVGELVDAAPQVDAEDGCFPLPTAPGLGVRLNRRACAQHPRTGGRLALFTEGWEHRDAETRSS